MDVGTKVQVAWVNALDNQCDFLSSELIFLILSYLQYSLTNDQPSGGMVTVTECCVDEAEQLKEISGTNAPTAVIPPLSLPSEPPDGNSSSPAVAVPDEIYDQVIQTGGMDSNTFILHHFIPCEPPDSRALTALAAPDGESMQTGGMALPHDHEEATFETGEDQCNVLINSEVYTLMSVEDDIDTETYF